MRLDEVRASSPIIPGHDEQLAFYSVGCCFWTSFPEDLGNTKDFLQPALKEEYATHLKDFGLPCCPHCGSVLMQAPLEKFLAAAVGNPGYYGPGGLEALVQAHSRNAGFCHQTWEEYTREEVTR